MKKLSFYLGALLGLFTLLACEPSSKKLRVGVTAGPHAIIMEKVKTLAETKDLAIEIIEFNDFILPNEALSQGELDINSFQHQPYLDEQIKSRGYTLTAVAKTVVMPLGIYSVTFKRLEELPSNARILIPNDPTNEGRSLKLLEKFGLITLKPSPNPSVLDIKTNPKNCQMITLEAPHIPRALKDADAGLINTDWVLLAGLDPSLALAHEDKDSPYANILVVKKGQENEPRVQKLVQIYQSDEVKRFIEETFKGAVIPAW
jgi:D-methionine transport system substrate-binding protein